MSDLKRLKLEAKGLSILLVEDNKVLQKNASKLLSKFFDIVDTADDGEEGLKKFEHKHYPIVITDIKMPHRDGICLSEHILKLHPQTKVIIMSAFDDKEYLFKAIELGIFRFLKKPVNLTQLTDVLAEAIKQIKDYRNKQLFYTHLKSVFNYQSSMVLMMHNSKQILANDMFLAFFDVESIEVFKKKHLDISTNFMPHDGFLCNKDGVRWLEELKKNEKKLFHIKMKNAQNKIRHLIVKYQAIPERQDYGILSFDDVTELNLLKLFDEKQSGIDNTKQSTKAMFDLLGVIRDNNAKIELHNFYKGLSITNDAIIVDINEKSVHVKTSFMQEKAIQFEQKTFIVSEALPNVIECSIVNKISFERQLVSLSSLSFISSSPILRKTIRVVPEEKHSVSLFLGENKFHGETGVEDISLDAVRLKLNALPAGLQKGDGVNLDIVLEMDKRPLIINTKATMYKKEALKRSFHVVFIFDKSSKKDLMKYITKRQMAIIREFKGMQNG